MGISVARSIQRWSSQNTFHRSSQFTCPIVLSLGVRPAALQATLDLQPIESREAKVALIQQRVRSNDKLALDVAEAALPAIEVFVVEAQLGTGDGSHERNQRSKETVDSG